MVELMFCWQFTINHKFISFNKCLLWSLIPLMLFVLSLLFVMVFRFDVNHKYTYVFFCITFYMFFWISKCVYLIFHILISLINLLFRKPLFFSFRKYVSFSMMILAFILQSYGITIGSNKISVTKYRLTIQGLPCSFNGFKIVQLSDIHLGSIICRKNFLKKIVDSCNYYNPDIIVFTGDLVNQYYEEISDSDTILKKLKSNIAKFAVLGNHDFGDYSIWKCPEQKEYNIRNIIRSLQKMGFILLRNNHTYIHIDNDSIAIVGVDNWGLKPFKQYGDIEKASQNVSTFAIVLSHDPTYWEEKIVKILPNSLTLSGHTHAFQFGFSMGDDSWSPVEYRYKHWWGVYKYRSSCLIVSRGLGMVGYLMRLGMWPEITFIELSND